MKPKEFAPNATAPENAIYVGARGRSAASGAMAKEDCSASGAVAQGQTLLTRPRHAIIAAAKGTPNAPIAGAQEPKIATTARGQVAHVQSATEAGRNTSS